MQQNNCTAPLRWHNVSRRAPETLDKISSLWTGHLLISQLKWGMRWWPKSFSRCSNICQLARKHILGVLGETQQCQVVTSRCEGQFGVTNSWLSSTDWARYWTNAQFFRAFFLMNHSSGWSMHTMQLDKPTGHQVSNQHACRVSVLLEQIHFNI